MPVISIVDSKNIIRAVKLKYGRDLGVFPLNLLRYKLDRIISKYNTNYADTLITRLIEDINFYEDLIHELYTADIELFRDPELWLTIANSIIPELTKETKKLNIYIPGCSNSFELYSLLILLEESLSHENVKVLISNSSPLTNEKVFKSNPTIRSKDIGLENFSLVLPFVKLDKYFAYKDGLYYFKKNKLVNIRSIITEPGKEELKEKFNFILFRDQLLNYNPHSQEIILNGLIKKLVKSGIIIFGYRESVSEILQAKSEFKALDEANRIFQKIA